MENASIIILVKEQRMILHSFYNSVKLKNRETLETDVEYIIFTLLV